MKPLTLVLLLVAAVAVAACGGESKADKAQKQVCSARDDLQTQVKKLQGLTPATATTNEIKDSLTAIQGDLRKMADAQGELSSQRKDDLQKANQAFASEFQSALGDLGTSLSATDAQAKVQAALQGLASAYQQSFAKLDCGS
jgi:Tfp pilus assembly protein PilP